MEAELHCRGIFPIRKEQGDSYRIPKHSHQVSSLLTLLPVGACVLEVASPDDSVIPLPLVVETGRGRGRSA